MKNILNLFIKGIIIGIGKVIPGVSGSVIAIMLGIYDKGVYALNHIFEDFINNFVFLLITGLGILISIIFGSKIILIFLNKYNFFIMSFFLGLILNSVYEFKKEIQLSKKNIYIVFIISIISLLICSLGINNVYNYKFTFWDNLFLIFVGVLEATTMIIPGISGTAVMMILGVYNLLLSTFSNLYSIDYISYNLLILLPFILGFILGFILITRIVEKFILNNDKSKIYILGFILGSFFILSYKTFMCFDNKFLFLSISLFIIGYIIPFLFKSNK